jgi:hypothetical protein
MRTLMLVAAVAACSPTITPGSYLCGPSAACPSDQVCDGVTDSCVLKGTAMPFACEMGTDFPGDDSAATARQIPQLACVSPLYVAAGCMPSGDAEDWLALSVPSTCTSVEVQARLSFPVAYEKLSLELWDLSMMARIGSDVPCAQSVDDPAHVERCITLPVTPGGNYGLVVKATSDGDCGGACAYNRYDLTVQLATPG